MLQRTEYLRSLIERRLQGEPVDEVQLAAIAFRIATDLRTVVQIIDAETADAQQATE